MRKQRTKQQGNNGANKNQNNQEHYNLDIITKQIKQSSYVPPKPQGKLIKKQLAQGDIKNKCFIKIQDIQSDKAQKTPKYVKKEWNDEGHVERKAFKVNSFKIDSASRLKTQSKQPRSYKIEKNLHLETTDINIKKYHNQIQIQSNRKKTQQDSKISYKSLQVILLKKGWKYKGQTAAGLFHGNGQLFHNDSLIYSGGFQCGYFNGYGRLYHHSYFSYLIKQNKNIEQYLNNPREPQWQLYIGQFKKGMIEGFGQLRFQEIKVIGKWNQGVLHHKIYSFVPNVFTN